MAKKKVLTTGEAAKICRVSLETIANCIDKGIIKGCRVPGSRYRRIFREDLIEFLKAQEMPLGELENKVLIVCQDQDLIENLKRKMPQELSFNVVVAADAFNAGMEIIGFYPDCVIVDFSIGRTEALQICQNLRCNTDFSEVIIVALLPHYNSPTSFDLSTIDEIFKKPFDVALLVKRIRTLIGEKELV